jgi:bilirubin oxidase
LHRRFTFANGNAIDYYEIEIKPAEVQLYPGLNKTRLVAYDGVAPGPTFHMTRGIEAVVRFINLAADRANSVSIKSANGVLRSPMRPAQQERKLMSLSSTARFTFMVVTVSLRTYQLNQTFVDSITARTPFDGWAEDITEVGEYKDYYYPNRQNARSLWYHDHAIDHTAVRFSLVALLLAVLTHHQENAYFGQAGFYIIHDDDELATQGLPQGAYDIPLALAARRYNFDGSLWSPEANLETVSLFGDVIHVNGQPWPFLAVEPRRYRFRLLNTSLSRTFELYFEDSAGRRFSFFVVAADTGLLSNPVATTELYMSMAERWEIVVDFTPFAGQNVTLRNSRDVGADEDYDSTDKVMRKSYIHCKFRLSVLR